MTLFVAKADGVTPATEDFTLGSEYVGGKPGPFWVSLQCWIHTADLVAAGGFKVGLEYLDPVSQTRTVETSAIGVNGSDGITQVGPVPIERLSDVSSMVFKTTLLGSGGTSLISYRLMITPADDCDLQVLPLTVV